jgi:hypothetical protein
LGDIEQVIVSRAGSALKIDVTLGGMVGLWNPPNGFDHVALTAFMALPGASGGSAVMPLQNADLPEGMRWHKRLRTHGWSNAWFDASGASRDKEGTPYSPGATLKSDRSQRTISFIVPAKALGNPATVSGAKLYLNTWDYDAGYRALSPEGGSMAFGGGKSNDAKVMDETPVLVIP